MSDGATSLRGIKDVFRETRAAMGPGYTVRRFAAEVLGDTIDPVMLGYIEKGKRFPSEALVRRLAAVRKQDAHELLALLWRDRILHAVGRELDRVLKAPRAVAGVEDGELAVLLSQAIAALPDDGGWIPLADWRRKIRAPINKRKPERTPVSPALARRVEETLRDRGLVEIASGKARKRGRHYVATGVEERRALALEFAGLFATTLVDKLALAEPQPGQYLRNHFLHVSPQRLPELVERLDAALRSLAEEFAEEPSASTLFFNMLVSTTTV